MKKIPLYTACCFLCLTLLSTCAQDAWTSQLSEKDEQNCFAEALEFFEKKDYSNAIKMFTFLYAQRGNLSDYAGVFLTRAYAKSGKDSEALRVSQEFLSRFPSHPVQLDVALLEASLLMKLQHLPDALTRYQALLQQQKVSEEKVLLAVGQAFAALGKDEEAVNAFQKLLQFYPSHSDAKDAGKALQKIVTAKPGLRPVMNEDALLTYAGKLLESRLYSLAIAQYRHFQTSFPESQKLGESELGLGKAYLRARKQKEGQRVLERAVKEYTHTRPEIAAEALYTLGRRSWNADRNREAQVLMQRILKEFRTTSWGDDAYYVLGRIYQSQRAYQAAAQSYRSLAKQFSTSSFREEALFRAGWSFYLAQNYSKASQLFLQASTAFPSGDYRANSRFWLGKSFEAAGDAKNAVNAYRSVLTDAPGTYYAVLAQNSLRAAPSQQAPQKAPALSDVLADLQSKAPKALYTQVHAHIRKAVALRRLDVTNYARREVEWIGELLETQALPSGDSKGLAWRMYFLARLYEGINEHLLAIRLAYRIDNMLRTEAVETFTYPLEYVQYPLLYGKLIRKYAAKYALDPFLVAGLIRQESAYNAKVTSPAGARGLMQIMPATGKRVARKLQLKNYSTARLFEPELNIAIGTAYLAGLLEDFDGNVFRALAGYNAGPNATKKWWTPERVGLEQEIIEEISYNETRNYVKYIVRNYAHYRRLYPELGSSN